MLKYEIKTTDTKSLAHNSKIKKWTHFYG